MSDSLCKEDIDIFTYTTDSSSTTAFSTNKVYFVFPKIMIFKDLYPEQSVQRILEKLIPLIEEDYRDILKIEIRASIYARLAKECASMDTLRVDPEPLKTSYINMYGGFKVVVNNTIPENEIWFFTKPHNTQNIYDEAPNEFVKLIQVDGLPDLTELKIPKKGRMIRIP